MAAIPLVANGVITDWSKTEISVAKLEEGAPAMPPIRGGFTKLDWDYGITGRENHFGNAAENVGQNEGNLDYSSTMGLFEAAWKKILTYLGDGFLSVDHRITINAVYKVDGKTHRVMIQGSIVKPSASWSQGSVHMRDVELKPTKIRETDTNGRLVQPIAQV
jgi:hypothetical protein